MHALIVVSHPDPQSLTHAVASRIAQGIAASDSGHTTEIADLTVEGFDPTFNADDRAQFLGKAQSPADVAAEQARIDHSDALILVYPIYWWSFPALLKGWIDRVFTNGWAFDDQSMDGTTVEKRLGRLNVHLVAIGGADMRTYARHGYFGAMKMQIDHGIFDYCGAPVVTSELLLPSDAGFPDAQMKKAHTIGSRVFHARPSR